MTDRLKRMRLVLIATGGGASLAIYMGLAALGDLRESLGLYLASHALLVAVYFSVLGVLARVERPRAGEARWGAACRSQPERSSEAPVEQPIEVPPARSGLGVSRPSPDHLGETPAGGAARPARQSVVPAFLRRLRADGAGPAGLALLFAAAFRLVLVLAPPTLSDDIFRYVWDGRVQAAGVNPYRYAPDSESLSVLRDAEWERINHKTIPTIYPPALEALFLATAKAGLRARGLKAVFCLFDLGAAIALASLLRRTGRAPLLAIAYAWNPLVVVEVAASGHADSVGVFFLLLATGLIIGERKALSIAAWVAAFLARLLPAIHAPVLLRRAGWKYVLFAIFLLVLGYAPYAVAGRGLFSGLGTYAENWEFNSVVFPAVRALIERTAPAGALAALSTSFQDAVGNPHWSLGVGRFVWPGALARGALLAALATGLLAISFRVKEIDRAFFLSTGLLLALTPTLHPWYLIWIVPFLALRRSVFWMLLCALAPLSYLSIREPTGAVPGWALLIEWGIPAGATAVFYAAGTWRGRS